MTVIRPIQYPADKLDRQIRDGIIPPPILDKNFAKLRNLGLHDAIPVAFSRASVDTSFWADSVLREFANDAAAFDHDPVSGVSHGLQVPGAATNLCLQSEDFSTTWTLLNSATLSTNDAVAPDGNTTADKLEKAAADANHRVRQVTVALSNATAYTISAFAKAAEMNWFLINFAGTAAPANAYAFFDVTNGAVGTVGAGADDTSITDIGGGWYRCTFTATTDAADTANIELGLAGADNDFSSGAGDAGDGIHLWGAGLEANSFPTPYIKTTTTSASRAATDATIPLASIPGFSATEGTVLVEFRTPSLSVTSGILEFNDGVGIEYNGIYFNSSGKIKLEIEDATAGRFDVESAAILAANETVKVGYVYSASGANLSLNGSLETEDTTGTLPESMTQMQIGGLRGGTLFPLRSTIARVVYWNRRLPDAQLQALTS